MGKTTVTATLVAAIFFSAASRAGPLRNFGYDTWSVGAAGMASVYGADAGALHYNPALLLDLADNFAMNILLFQPLAQVRLMSKPPNADIPLTFYDSDVGIEGENLDRPLPTVELYHPRANNRQDSTAAFAGIGLVLSPGIEQFRLGLCLLVPVQHLAKIKTWYPDERDQYFSNTVHFVRFAEWNQILSFLVGAAYQPFEWLRVGASVEGTLLAAAVLDAFVPEATVQDYALSNLEMDAKAAVRGIIGLSFQPLDWLRTSLVWRDRRYMKLNTDVWLKLWNFHESGDVTKPKLVHQRHTLALDFEPMEATLAAGVRLGDVGLEVSLTWEHWADYLDPHHQRGQQTATFDPVNEGDSPVDGDPFAFKDTWSPAANVAWYYREGWTATAGLAWHPSPVPPQVGRTSYADSDILQFGLGHRWEGELLGRRWKLDAGVQLARLFPRTVYKNPTLIRDEFPDRARTLIGHVPMPEAQGLQTNNPGFPGYDFAGWAITAALALSYLF